MGDEYLLVDLQKQSDDEIEQKKHLGMMGYMLKHIKARDILNLWQSLFEKFASSIEIDKENGYYNGGQIIFCDNNFSSKVLSNFGNLFILEDVIPDYVKGAREVKIISGCDKNFITCCNKFNNAINFRGEPLIPDKDFINSHLI